MKRLLAGTLAAALALGLTGCSQQQEEGDAKPVISLYPEQQEECDAKPVIYLYPEQQTEVEVSLD